jgi:GNAT superfamily N-acetyltransferase
VPDIASRPYEDRDLEGVLDLLRAALGETPILKRTPALFAWKHLDNPFGRSILMVAEADKRIVGLRALMRWELDHPRGRLRCVRAVDTATHPDYQRRGIFRMLTEHAVASAQADGIDLIFNTPNPQSGAGYLSMGWNEVDHIGVMARPMYGLLRRRPPPVGAPDPAEFTDVPVLTAEPIVATRTSARLRTPRTADYLKWRFTDHPTARYVLYSSGADAVIVRPNIRKGRRELVVSDIFGPAPDKLLRPWLRKCGADYAAGWFSKDSPERRAAVRAGLLPVPRMQSLRLIARPLRSLPIDVFDLNNWDFAMSDLELL